MEGMNKKINQEVPAAPAASTLPKNPIDTNARPFSFMSPSRPPRAPTSFQGWQKPYFTTPVGASGASSSGTKTPFSQAPDPVSMKGENNNQTDQNPSAMSDQNLTLQTSSGDNSDKTEVAGIAGQVRWGRKLDLDMDPKKLRRVISNRLSAQRSRMKKLQHVADMEKKVETLQAQIAVLGPQVALYRNQKYLLQMEQENLNQQLTACANRKALLDAEIEANKAEVYRLRRLQLLHQQQKLQAQTRMTAWEAGLTEQMMNPGLNLSVGTGQTMYVNPNEAPVEDTIAELNRLNELSMKLQQEQAGQISMPGWEPWLGPLTNVGLSQSEPEQVQNPGLSQSTQLQNFGLNSNLGGLEDIVNNNTLNQNPRNDFI